MLKGMDRHFRFSLFLALLSVVLGVQAQVVVSGVVTDRDSRSPLSHVSVTAGGTDIHTVTNDDGRFTLKLSERPAFLQLTHIGYTPRRYELKGADTSSLRIPMTATTVRLDEVVISADDPRDIVEAAMARLEQNYPRQPELVRCFYRETARRGSRFISVAEAVIDMYKSSYAFGPERDAVAILKGRRLMSMKSSDTLGVKMQGGPVLPLMVDVAKNREYLLNADCLPYYTYRQELSVRLNDRLHYVISMTPSQATAFPLIGGLLYIDRETLTITRAELELDCSDRQRASAYMLVRKPFTLRFRPRELKVVVAYQTDSLGVTRMVYVRNELRFHCDWKRRLFSNSYTLESEMVVTDRLAAGKDAKRPRGRSSFGIHERFYDRVEYFNDPYFWADYNIIEPSERLENAITKLKKKVTRP